MKSRTIAVAAVAVFGVATVAIAASYEADATPNEKVTICHATSSEKNPYTVNTVDSSSIDEQNNKYLNGHGDHERDIIPPFQSPDGTVFGGHNWTPEGQAIWNNGCKIPAPTPTEVTPVAPTLGEPTCDPPRDITIPDVNGVQYTRTTHTDGSITVTATPANDDYVFAAGADTEWTFTAAQLAEEPPGGCDDPPDPPTEVTPVDPEMTERTCDPPRDVIIPDVDGITYTETGDPIGPITVTATADTGYVITDGATTEWTFTAEQLAEEPPGGCDVPTEPDGETEPPTGVAGETATNTPAPEVTAPEQVAAQPATLPETGAETWVILLIGLASAATGLVLVRLTKQPA